MSFAQPLWWFLAVPVVGAILLMHRRRQRTVIVASLLPWEGDATRGAAASGAGRVPSSWPLFLQIFAALLAIAALTGPRFTSEDGERERVVVVTARDGDAAADAVATLLAGYGPTEAVTVLDGRRPARPLWLHERPEVVSAGLRERLVSSEAEPDWSGSLRYLARVDASAESDVTAIVAPDEAIPEEVASAFSNGGRTFRTAGVGPARPRVGIADAVVSRLDGEVVVTMRGVTREEEDLDVVLEVVGSGSAVFRQELTLAPGGTRVELPLPEPHTTAERLDLRLLSSQGDLLASVRRTAPSSEPALRHHVLVVGEPIDAIRRWARTGQQVRVTESTTLPTDLSDVDLLVVNGVELERRPSGPHLVWFGSVPPDARAEVRQAEGVVTVLRPDEPLVPLGMAHEITLEAWLPIHPLAGAQTLAAVGDWPVIQARVQDGRGEVVVAFDLDDSDWLQQASLPVLLERLLAWGDPPLGRDGGPACVVGVPCALPPTIAPSVVLPDGTSEGIERLVSYEPWFVPRRSGSHEFGEGEEARSFWVDPPVPLVGEGDHPPPEGATDAAARAALATLPLWVALAALGGVAAAARQRWPLRGPRAAASAAAALVLLAFALAAFLRAPWPEGPSLPRTVVVVPAQAERSEAVEVAIRERLGSVASRDGVRVVRTVEGSGGADFADDPVPSRDVWSDMGTGLSMASALVRDSMDDRIVLLASRAADDGASMRDVNAAAERAGGLSLVETPPFATVDEVVIEHLRVLGEGAAGSAVRLVADLLAPRAGRARIVLQAGDEIVYEETLLVEAGRTTVVIDVDPVPDDPTHYLLDVRSTGSESVPWGRSVVLGQERPTRVAVVSDEHAWSLLFAQLLEVHGLDVTRIDAADAPRAAAGWLSFDTVVLHDMPAIAMISEQQQALHDWVQGFGGGLLLLGGERAFGPGGYHLTPLDDLSPLGSEIPMDRPDVAVLFVLDRSGSMVQGVGEAIRLDIAREATWEAINLMDPRSQVGIVVFDSASTLIHPVRPIRDLGSVRRSLNLLTAGGGTALHPALVQAHEALSSVTDVERHMLVMTDGLTQSGDFDSIMERIVEDEITVSTVAIGRGAFYPRLRLIAEATGGTFYESVDFRLLPSIMAQEILMLTTRPVREGPVPIEWADEGAAFVPSAMRERSEIGGLVRTEARSGADLHAQSDAAEPLLASWRYGLGRVVAWSSQAAGPWTLSWLSDPAAPRMWSEAARWAGRSATREGLHGRILGGNVLQVEAVDDAGRPLRALGLEARVQASGGGEPTLVGELREVSPGVYQALLTGATRDGGATFVVEVAPVDASGPAIEPITLVGADQQDMAFPSGTPEYLRSLVESVGGSTTTLEEWALEAPRPTWSWNPSPARRPWLVGLVAAYLIALASLYAPAISNLGRARRHAYVRGPTV